MDVGEDPGDFPGCSALCLVVQSWPSGDYHSAMFYILYILLPYFVNHINMYFLKYDTNPSLPEYKQSSCVFM